MGAPLHNRQAGRNQKRVTEISAIEKKLSIALCNLANTAQQFCLPKSAMPRRVDFNLRETRKARFFPFNQGPRPLPAIRAWGDFTPPINAPQRL